MTKAEVRKRYLDLRKKLTPDEIESLSLGIANQFLRLPIWDMKYFHVFLPIRSKNEVDTEFLLTLLQGKDKEVVLSRSDFESHQMHHFLLTDSTRIIVNEYGIPEPEDGIEVPPNKIEAVIVPLLAFDANGQRIGYGKGFYDRFLSDCNSNVLKIGVSFYDISDSWEDVLPTDIALDFCVTPENVFDFRQV
ncbi:5-formyltetrahydrofolate cyclo-ligase [Flavobacterium silvaticum]|uniref:5-formyltetrahydrofolate cyclo-ligase n=1 Tax=Flavobacterium silvaticum TaxID=1852020 RepID=A0A972FSC8_9FLAO|nr:5-formyltetrahydrofolate cyclo-ligase [Flavobacterium silvaticum]NMH27608.1 5-formyltetrahydrofolate cyclo-ligase [Flavobacterium silvaticum]